MNTLFSTFTATFEVMDLKDFLRKKRFQKGLFKPFFILLWYLFNVLRFFFNTSYRARIIQAYVYKNAYHQFSNFTEYNRYPDLFKMAKLHVYDLDKPKILSFGCSTGEEVLSIEAYMPQASIVGVDINKWCLKMAKKKTTSLNIHFLHSLSSEFDEMGDFDVIFCLAVFQHPDNRHNRFLKESAYRFDKFENQLLLLDKKLKSGGLLIIDHTDFNFLETQLMYQYVVVPNEGNLKRRKRPLFNKSGLKVSDAQTLFRVFQKK